MNIALKAAARTSSTRNYELAVLALDALPDHCVRDVGELASRIGADKLELISWGRADIKFARLLASKVAP